MPLKRYHVVSHTHWDREWYEPFEVFRIRLVRLMDHLLELVESEPAYRFNLDAQTILLDDYLEIRPENRERLMRAIHSGNILVGPWYVQNDFYQTCGESTIRNLLLGIKKACEFGNTQKMTGYAPDHFGIISQLPQILCGFGLDSLIFGRGRVCNEENGKKSEFIFTGIDGSRILAVQLAGFYNNAQRFSADHEKAKRFFHMILEKIAPCFSSGEYLLMNGCDHLEPQENLLPILKKLQMELPDGDEIFQSTFREYTESVKKRLKASEIHHGELRESGERLLSIGTLSCRIGQKILNTRAENKLFLQLQGLGGMLVWSGFGNEVYDRNFMDYLCRLLLQNQPHDSICGCSADSVNRHIMDRFLRFQEASEMLLQEKLYLLTNHIEGGDPKNYCILIVNSLPFRRGTIAEAQVDLLEEEQINSFRLLNPEGVEIPYTVVKEEVTERALRSPVNLPGRKRVIRKTIRFYSEVPAMGYTLLTVDVQGKAVSGKPLDFRNEYLALTVHPDGKIDLEDLKSGRTFRDLLYLEDTGDFGDAYTYRPYPDAEVVTTNGMRPDIRIDCNNHIQSICTLKYNLSVPMQAKDNRKERSEEHRELPVQIRLTVSAHAPCLEVEVSGINTCRDHFLRAVVRTGIDSDLTQSSGIFEIAERNRCHQDIVPRTDREEPVRDFVRLRDQAGSMAILTDGLHSFEHYRERCGEIGIGLVRSTGYLMGYYETPLDKTWHVPENQCLGDFSGHFAVMPGSNDADCGREAFAAQSFNHPFLVRCDSFDRKKFSGGRPCVQDTEVSEIFEQADPYAALELPKSASFCSVAGNELLLSTVKQSEDGNFWILRFWNRKREKVEANLHFGMSLRSAERWNMAEDQLIESLPLTGKRSLKLSADGAEIITLKIEPETYQKKED